MTSIGAIIVAAIVGIFSSRATLEWAARNGKRIGRWVAKRVPGDKLEEWLITFLQGIADGLSTEVQESHDEVSVSAGSTKLTVAKSRIR